MRPRRGWAAPLSGARPLSSPPPSAPRPGRRAHRAARRPGTLSRSWRGRGGDHPGLPRLAFRPRPSPRRPDRRGGGPALAAIATRFAAYPEIEFGWGEARFYRATPTLAQFDLRLALEALFTPGGRDGVVQVVGLERPARASFPQAEIVPVRVSPAGLARLLGQLEASFRLAGGQPVAGGPASTARACSTKGRGASPTPMSATTGRRASSPPPACPSPRPRHPSGGAHPRPALARRFGPPARQPVQTVIFAPPARQAAPPTTRITARPIASVRPPDPETSMTAQPNRLRRNALASVAMAALVATGAAGIGLTQPATPPPGPVPLQEPDRDPRSSARLLRHRGRQGEARRRRREGEARRQRGFRR